MKEIIHFAHGNGFPSLCYSQLFHALEEAHFTCCFIEKIGHNPKYPVTENWPYLVDEVIDSIHRQSNEPVIAVGHSLGGVLSMLAAIKQPSLFKAVIMIDSPLLGRLKSNMVKLAKVLGVIDRVTPAHRTRTRRQIWNDKQQLIQYLKSRPLFKTFSEACLQDYMEFGLKKGDDGRFHLVFDSRIEYSIYRSIPHHLYEYAGKLTVPTALIYGSHSDVVSRLDVHYMKHNFNIRCFKMKGTHMLPMEEPDLVANHIIRALDAIL
ncbi:alpha/beta fold hydrolase [Legionella spiritensis]|uniref:Hydrolase/acyltransferase n=1 Tax=Legionella spiritensis TaxID=452 RepID=A0A0W0Z6Q5_LEGSP|nr:alpha/beta hydrolase [Legionella spiritensis]KTD64795.1 hydrolase/acyltransferase [Legionella spiritensis]SNV39875.1 hydrolases or acyltransferases (alpha/beta hydrolase superfamily) [Legionella spiritensis]VEG90436.1 hydrolases or acyltransferases (alpha/beta hydrolase superfamily) [Legionella spiritensis]